MTWPALAVLAASLAGIAAAAFVAGMAHQARRGLRHNVIQVRMLRGDWHG